MCITLYSQSPNIILKIRFWVFTHGLWRAGSLEYRVIPAKLMKREWKYPLKHQEAGGGTPLKDSELGALDIKLGALVGSLKCTSVTQSILCLIILMCVRNHASIKLQWTGSKNNLHFMMLIYLWSWNKVKGHQTWHELPDPEQGYNHAKFDRPPFNSVTSSSKTPTLQKTCPLKIIYLLPCCWSRVIPLWRSLLFDLEGGRSYESGSTVVHLLLFSVPFSWR